MTDLDAVAPPPPTSPRAGLFGGQVSSKKRPVSSEDADAAKKRTRINPWVVLADAQKLIQARKGRLALGLAIMAVSRVAGLVLPGVSKLLVDNVILAKGLDMAMRMRKLELLMLVAGAATVVQAISSFRLSQLFGTAGQRSITETRRRVQRHVGRLSISYFEHTQTRAL